jgi:nitroreductase/NAD-dependent dihydropyrimidine dehydrogenase PreA subunit
MFAKSINRSLCDACGECIRICRGSRVLAAGDDGYPRYEKERKCIECGHCLAICPRGAISFLPGDAPSPERFLADSREIDPRAGAPGALPDLLASLRSTRVFDGREVERKKLEAILEAMVRSPSAGNEQNRNYYLYGTKRRVDELESDVCAYYTKTTAQLASPVARKFAAKALAANDLSGIVMRNRLIADLPRKEREAAYESLFADLAAMYAAREYPLFHGSSAAIVVTSNTNTTEMHKSFHKADAEISVTYATIAAAGLGLASCRMGLAEMAFAADGELRDKYRIPAVERVDGVVAFGYSPLEWKRLPPRGPVKAVWM